MRTLSLVGLSVAACLLACSSAGTSRGSAPSGQRNLISYEEIQDVTAVNAWEAVQALRSHWLRPRSATLTGGGSMVLPEVFVDHQHWGPLDSLRQLRTESIQQIQFIAGPDATTRFGTGYMGGIIYVLLRR
jgi:hypothetical protein